MPTRASLSTATSWGPGQGSRAWHSRRAASSRRPIASGCCATLPTRRPPTPSCSSCARSGVGRSLPQPVSCPQADRARGLGVDGDEVPAPALVVAHRARRGGEQRVVTTAAHTETRVDPCPALADQDGAALHELATEDLDPEPLRVGITAVA